MIKVWYLNDLGRRIVLFLLINVNFAKELNYSIAIVNLSLLRNVTIALLLSFISISHATAQPEGADTNRLKARFGIYGNFGPDLNIASFTSLPGIPSCCAEYGFTASLGAGAGALVEFPLDIFNSLELRVGYARAAVEFYELESTTGLIAGRSEQVDFGHYLNTSFDYLDISPSYNYRIWEKLWLRGGLALQVPIASDFSSIEKVETAQGTFDDGRRFRNAEGGTLESARMRFGLFVGGAYDLPMQKRPGLFLVPEFNLRFFPVGPVSDASWSVFDMRAGVALKYRTPPVPPPPPPPPALPPVPNLQDPPPPPSITANLDVKQRDSLGRTVKDMELKIEDFVSFNMRPLLNYVFFDEGSSVIPARYELLDKDEVRGFGINQLRKSDDLETYYHVLNILGDRMRSNPDIRITVTGHNSDEGVEKDDKELSMARAQSVVKYFTDVWSIDPRRIEVKARNLPVEESRTDTLPGHEENRRVEITSSSDEIEQPVMTNDTIRQINKTKFVFLPRVEAELGVRNWRLKAKQGSKVLFEKSGDGVPPDSIVWDPETEGSRPSDGQAIFVDFQAWDSLGTSDDAPQRSISIEQLTVDQKRLERRRDKEFEYYGLILFDYGKTSLNGKHRQTVDFVKSRIQQNDTVTVLGYSDSMGEADVNKRIAERRARSVSQRLRHRKTGVYGIGEENLIFDNSLPEGRFYCRTVRISVESVVNEENIEP